MRFYRTRDAYIVAGFIISLALVWGSKPTWSPFVLHMLGQRTVSDAAEAYRRGVKPLFDKKGISYPPRRLTILAFKQERHLEVWAGDASAQQRIATYPITAASGQSGPKLRRGDMQVPEGIYQINVLNPNSRFHLSMGLNYPNALDRKWARNDGRSDLGDAIYIHGGAGSVGCIAIGDAAIEAVFCMVAETGPKNTRVIVAPRDFRDTPPRADETGTRHLEELYRQLTKAMGPFGHSRPSTSP